METVKGEEEHVYDVGFFDENAATRGVAVDSAAETAEGGAFGTGERWVLGARAKRVVPHCFWWVEGGNGGDISEPGRGLKQGQWVSEKEEGGAASV